jgi:hypothetical protein
MLRPSPVGLFRLPLSFSSFFPAILITWVLTKE